MAHFLITIKKRSTFVHVKDHGRYIRSSSFNVQILEDLKLEKMIAVGYTATKRLGKAVIRNKCKRIRPNIFSMIFNMNKSRAFFYCN